MSELVIVLVVIACLYFTAIHLDEMEDRIQKLEDRLKDD